jgi:hypothetical protein
MKNKVRAAGLGGAVATVIVWTAGQFGVDMPPEVASAWAALLGVAAGWFAKEA